MDRLRVLVADEPGEYLDRVARTVSDLGHEVISTADISQVGAITASQGVDVALVIVGEGSERALGMIDGIVHEAACPVIAVLDVQQRTFVEEAARRGVFAYIVNGDDSEEFQSSIEIVLHRFREYHDLEGAFGRRAVTERAKGILMERHGIDEEEAFGMLRDEARRSRRKIVDVAQSVLGSHRLLGAPEGETRAQASEEGSPQRSESKK